MILVRESLNPGLAVIAGLIGLVCLVGAKDFAELFSEILGGPKTINFHIWSLRLLSIVLFLYVIASLVSFFLERSGI